MENLRLTNEELLLLENHYVAMKTITNEIRPRTNLGLWKQAFDWYNENHQAKVNMTCRPCYFKVIDWCRKQFYNPEPHE
jgi:hypothetical protein